MSAVFGALDFLEGLWLQFKGLSGFELKGFCLIPCLGGTLGNLKLFSIVPIEVPIHTYFTGPQNYHLVVYVHPV